MSTIIDTKFIINREKVISKEIIDKFINKPHLKIISVGSNVSNEKYVNNKLNHCKDIGITTNYINLNANINKSHIINVIKNTDKPYESIILQLPLSCNQKIDVQSVLENIPPNKDVDGLTIYNQGRLFIGNPFFVPATPLGCITFLKEINYNLEGKNVLVIGRSQLLGNSLSQLLLQHNATVTQAHSNSKFDCDKYDVVVSAVGKPLIFKNISAEIIIDCGISFVNGKMVGDIDIDTCHYKYATIPPNKDKNISAGIGTITCLCLLQNIIKSFTIQGGY
ncbi:hypothetical protein AN639_07725 [Candidatus Epulonipiscium fishelsonii]|uniref:Uncharacterized protein n=1 Tax=Candidatus Epulonipiscium fishelsonii TaxID=77094 RepID=A0ACC8XBB4_9FIRM|nr:hypothetical protein AN639_07725 [Epulopiscium sp. SCG-B05WGA-EpuloA1]ONI39781.1 hypothetical protein AN396_06915 [Epulopiscium sp. SCG-B11WGA-EpuloA1]